jgi:hypothetical protein
MVGHVQLAGCKLDDGNREVTALALEETARFRHTGPWVIPTVARDDASDARADDGRKAAANNSWDPKRQAILGNLKALR